MKKLSVLFVEVLVLIAGLTGCSRNNRPAGGELTEEEKNDLLFLREEEKLARDVYLYAYDKYALQEFANISSSEQRHMDAVKVLLDKYGLEDPAKPNRGEFSDSTLQQLYDNLTALVDSSQIDALRVGATIEDLDINDIREMKERTGKSDILNVYNRLECGSRNHMRAYYSALEALGVIYVAQYISQDELDVIIGSTNERCGRQ